MSLDVDHICPRCRSRFVAPVYLSDTFCPECFTQAFHLTAETPAITPRPWHPGRLGGIMCLIGAFLVALWILSGR